MTIISPFDGLGAGRAISGPDDREKEEQSVRKVRHPRAGAERRAEQDWLRSRLREQALRSDTLPAGVMPSASGRRLGHQSGVRSELRVEPKTEWPAKTVGEPAGERNTTLQAPAAAQPLLPELEVLRTATDAPASGRVERLAPAVDSSVPAVSRRHATQEPSPDGNPNVDELASLTGERPVVLRGQRGDPGPTLESILMRLRAPVARIANPQVLANLDDLNRALRSARAPAPGTREHESLHAHLDFLEGYYEQAKTPGPESTKILQLMQEVRCQLAVASDPLMTTTILQSGGLSMVSQASRSVSPGGLAELRNTAAKTRDSLKEGKAGTEVDDEAVTDAPLSLPTSGTAAAQIQRTASSSLGRDTEKRRQETPVSVVVRSV